MLYRCAESFSKYFQTQSDSVHKQHTFMHEILKQHTFLDTRMISLSPYSDGSEKENLIVELGSSVNVKCDIDVVLVGELCFISRLKLKYASANKTLLKSPQSLSPLFEMHPVLGQLKRDGGRWSWSCVWASSVLKYFLKY